MQPKNNSMITGTKSHWVRATKALIIEPDNEGARGGRVLGLDEDTGEARSPLSSARSNGKGTACSLRDLPSSSSREGCSPFSSLVGVPRVVRVVLLPLLLACCAFIVGRRLWGQELTNRPKSRNSSRPCRPASTDPGSFSVGKLSTSLDGGNLKTLICTGTSQFTRPYAPAEASAEVLPEEVIRPGSRRGVVQGAAADMKCLHPRSIAKITSHRLFRPKLVGCQALEFST